MTTPGKWFAGRKVLFAGVFVGVVTAIAAAIFLPDAVEYTRFSRALDKQAAVEAKNGAWPQLHDECALCHGVDGNAVSQDYPRLAGQTEVYLRKQLEAFASGARSNGQMGPLAAQLSPESIDALARFYASKSAAPNSSFSPDAARVARGAALATEANCASCHGARYAGQDTNPRLAGQGQHYLVRQLNAYKSGARRDQDGAMTAVAAGLSDNDVEVLADYLAALQGTAQ